MERMKMGVNVQTDNNTYLIIILPRALEIQSSKLLTKSTVYLKLTYWVL